MNLIPYAELARLRLRDFIGDVGGIWVEESGMQIVVGLGGFERIGETSFGWRQGEPYQTAEVTLDLAPTSTFPSDSAKRVIEMLKLPVHKGMTGPELVRALGEPQVDQKTGSRRFLRFVCGEKERYFVGCGVDDQHGLVHLFLARKDYCDEDESL